MGIQTAKEDVWALFDNIGGKIKKLATIICVIGLIASLIAAIGLWLQHDQYNLLTQTRNNTIWDGICVLFGGCVASWTGCFCLYGFGQLIEDTAAIHEALKSTSKLEMKPMMKESVHEAKPKPVVQAVPTVVKKTEIAGWTCRKCKCINASGNDICSRCGTEKVRIVSSSWVCKNCGLRNYSGTVCEDCGKSNE